MSELKPRITENGIDYILVGDYYIPDLKLPEEHCPIGKYGRMHREYLREVCPARLHHEWHGACEARGNGCPPRPFAGRQRKRAGMGNLL